MRHLVTRLLVPIVALGVTGGGGLPIGQAATACAATGGEYTAYNASLAQPARGSVNSEADGTPIVYNIFLPNSATSTNPATLVLNGHGWGGSGTVPPICTNDTISRLLAHNYAVITWDSRGFGQSGGEANVDSPDLERIDASTLIDLAQASSLPLVRDLSGAPLVGMVGVSYAGGIQLVTAAFDSRVKAIAPEITWNDLTYSLFPHNVIKLGWTQLLYAAGLATAGTAGITCEPPAGSGCAAGIQTGNYSTALHASEVRGLALGYPDELFTKPMFRHNSLAYHYDAGVTPHAATLLMQGANDTLFNLNDAYANLTEIASGGTPVKFVAFCGGHVTCPYAADPVATRDHLDGEILAWFDRYLRGNANAATGTPVEYETQDGTFHDTYAVPQGGPCGTCPGNWVSASGASLPLISAGAPTSGGTGGSYTPIVTDGPSQAGDPGTWTLPILTAAAPTTIFGLPHINVAVSGLGAGAHLYFKLVDVAPGGARQVVNLQAESFRVEASSLLAGLTISDNLAGVSYTVPKDDTLVLQVATGSLAHVSYRGPAVVNISGSVSVPVV